MSNDTERYDFDTIGGMVPHSGGDWVRLEDYKAVVAENDLLRVRLEVSQKVVNQIDDLLEYVWVSYSLEGLRQKILEIIKI